MDVLDYSSVDQWGLSRVDLQLLLSDKFFVKHDLDRIVGVTISRMLRIGDG